MGGEFCVRHLEISSLEYARCSFQPQSGLDQDLAKCGRGVHGYHVLDQANRSLQAK